jgi:hypothetical protein
VDDKKPQLSRRSQERQEAVLVIIQQHRIAGFPDVHHYEGGSCRIKFSAFSNPRVVHLGVKCSRIPCRAEPSDWQRRTAHQHSAGQKSRNKH